MTTLHEAYQRAKKNGGAPGIDGQSFADVEQEGVIPFLRNIQVELQAGTYRPQANRKVDIPKANGKMRTLQIPSIRDRVVQGALKLILEAIFEADFCPNSYGFRPKRSPHQALAEVRRSILRRMTTVIDIDLFRSHASGHIDEEARWKLLGYYQYYAITDNYLYADKFQDELKRRLFRWLNRRSQRRSFTWDKFIQF